jgi:aminoglycoside phosphotransferase family enzyme
MQPPDSQVEMPVDISQKVQFLSQAVSYPEGPVQVEVSETHMSWVFLTDSYAYKLKKPVRRSFLDFSTLAARYQDCQAELRLNRRLAPTVYLDVAPLTVDSAGNLQLNGTGETVDWLVKMRRLPASGMLDVAIQQGTVGEREVDQVAQRLTRFYQSLPPVEISAVGYRQRLVADLSAILEELAKPEYALPVETVEHILPQLLADVREQPELFDRRVRERRIIEGHGDLRPQHICLRPEIAIIDCLEFNRSLRILDPVDELAFLALECERLDAAWIGERILQHYCGTAQDHPPQRLIRFYKTYRACLCTKLALWHLREPGEQGVQQWVTRAATYLQLAEKWQPAGCREGEVG